MECISFFYIYKWKSIIRLIRICTNVKLTLRASPIKRVSEFKYFGTYTTGVKVKRRMEKSQSCFQQIEKYSLIQFRTSSKGFGLLHVIYGLYFCIIINNKGYKWLQWRGSKYGSIVAVYLVFPKTAEKWYRKRCTKLIEHN